MPQIRLSDADRERLKLPPELEWLDFTANTVTVRQAMVLRSVGYATPAVWRQALNPPQQSPTAAVAKLDKLLATLDADSPLLAELEPLRVEVVAIEDELSTRRGADDGIDLMAWVALVWLALQQNGRPTVLAELDFDLDSLSTRRGADDANPEPEGSGKAGSPAPTPPDEPS